MTSKDIAIQTIQQLPEDATWEDIQERINFVGGVRKGLRELDQGKGIAHEKVKQEFRAIADDAGPCRIELKIADIEGADVKEPGIFDWNVLLGRARDDPCLGSVLVHKCSLWRPRWFCRYFPR